MVRAPPSPTSSASSSISSSTSVVKPVNTFKLKGPLSVQEIGTSLNASVDVLHALGYTCCLFGSAGCSMYGMDHRCPSDVDIVVLTSSETCEEIKARIAKCDKRFTLIPARNPVNKWNVMWFTVSSRPRRKCKIDILTQGTISIPHIPPHRIVHYHGIPLAPFLCLLLMKLQGYFDHLASDQPRMKKKLPEDVDDVQQMARLGAQVYRVNIMELREEWFDAQFRLSAFERVRQFSVLFPESNPYWEAMDFTVVRKPVTHAA